MTTFHPNTKELPLAEIEVRDDRLRPVSEDAVLGLIELIEEYGFTTPILVRKTRAGFVLVDGMHRMEAMRRLGFETIPVIACSCTDDEAALMEAGQNLPGGMNALDDAVFLAAWRRAYLRKYPETGAGVAGGLARQGQQGKNFSFAKVVAEKRGVTERAVRMTIAAAERLTRAEIDSLRSAPKVAVNDLREIGKITDPEERAQVVLKLSGGNARNAATARRQWKAENGLETPAKDPVEGAFQALLEKWQRAPRTARRRFVEAAHDEIAEIIADIAERGHD